MTESEWLACEDPQAMLAWLLDEHQHQVEPTAGCMPSDRKLRLFDDALIESLDMNTPAMLAGQLSPRSETAARIAADLLRDIAGNPFRPMPSLWSQRSYYPDPDGNGPPVVERYPSSPWLTPTVLSLAQAAYQERQQGGTLDPLALAELSDALEEAGCQEEALLRHLRGEEVIPSPHMPKWGFWQPLRGPHVRGCYAVDTILGLE